MSIGDDEGRDPLVLLLQAKVLDKSMARIDSTMRSLQHLYQTAEDLPGLTLDRAKLRQAMLRLVDAYEAVYEAIDPENAARLDEAILEATREDLQAKLGSWRKTLLTDAAAEAS